jgi:hypothetical protein
VLSQEPILLSQCFDFSSSNFLTLQSQIYWSTTTHHQVELLLRTCNNNNITSWFCTNSSSSSSYNEEVWFCKKKNLIAVLLFGERETKEGSSHCSKETTHHWIFVFTKLTYKVLGFRGLGFRVTTTTSWQKVLFFLTSMYPDFLLKIVRTKSKSLVLSLWILHWYCLTSQEFLEQKGFQIEWMAGFFFHSKDDWIHFTQQMWERKRENESLQIFYLNLFWWLFHIKVCCWTRQSVGLDMWVVLLQKILQNKYTHTPLSIN